MPDARQKILDVLSITHNSLTFLPLLPSFLIVLAETVLYNTVKYQIYINQKNAENAQYDDEF